MNTIKLTTTLIRAIARACDAPGCTKELGERVDLADGSVKSSYNCMLFEEHDLYDRYKINELRGAEIELVDGEAELDIWLYTNNPVYGYEPSGYATIFLKTFDIAGRPFTMVNKDRRIDNSDLFKAGLARAAGVIKSNVITVGDLT